MNFTIRSTAFSNHAEIPVQFSGEGENLSPPLSWSGVPAGTAELALLCDDPDAPSTEPFCHWILVHISPTVMFLPEGISNEAHLVEPLQGEQGRNSSGDIGYTGPMPPVGHGRHRYYFKLFALDQKVDFPAKLDRTAFLNAIQGKTLGTAELIGIYERTAAKKKSA